MPNPHPVTAGNVNWRLAMRRAGFKKGWVNRIRCRATKRDGPALQTAGDGQRRRVRLRLSRRVCSGREEGTAQPDAQVPDVPAAQKNFQNSDMKLYSAGRAKPLKKIVPGRPPSEL